jgi:hypothetical protein
MKTQSVPKRPASEDLLAILDIRASPEFTRFVDELQATRWVGRRGYSFDSLASIVLIKSLYNIPTWPAALAFLHDHPALVAVIAPNSQDIPSVSACHRVTSKLLAHPDPLAQCNASTLSALDRLKHQRGLSPSCERAIQRVALETELMVFAHLTYGLDRARDLSSTPRRRQPPG